MRKKTGRRSAAELAAEFFDIPGEAAGASRVTITGCSRVQIENHRGIAEYGRERICVRCGRMTVRITGSCLELRAMNSDDLLITGMICAVAYEA